MGTPLDFDWSVEKERIRDAVRQIWTHPSHLFYTDHGPGHSDRVYHYCHLLSHAWQFSREELDVLWTCSYIHDIGMQFADWGRHAAGPRKTVAKALGEKPLKDPTWIRDNHCDLGLKLISAELNGERTWDAPRSFCTTEYGHPSSFLWTCARIAFAHSRGTMWDEACRTAPKDARHPSGKKIRTALLIGAFRLADELDGCKRRIGEMTRVLHSAMPPSSISHWLACWFVDEIDLRTSDESIEVSISWQAPTGASDEEIEEIREFLKLFRSKRIRRVADEISGFFTETRKDALRRSFTLRGLDGGEEPERVPFPDWKVLRPAVQRALKAAGWRPPRGWSKGRSRRLSAADVKDVLNNWSLGDEGFRRGRHFILERGLHTDTFVNCRPLGSDRDLVSGVSNWLDRRVGEVELCVAVGTSMIPFALEFARRRGTGLTFTFANPTLRFGDTKIDRFAEVESAPFVSKSCKGVLVLDDIIAVGEGARSVVEELRGGEGMEGCAVWHYSLFRLGRQRFARLEGVVYGWLCWIRDVHYWREASCPVCAREPREPPVREADILM
jgi:orotate phosphoribosyltransferase